MTPVTKCPICDRLPQRITPIHGQFVLEIDCATCGRFEVSHEFLEDGWLNDVAMLDKRHLLSAFTKAHKGRFVLDKKLIEQVGSGLIAEKTVSEKIALVLQCYARKSTEIGDFCPVNAVADYPLAWCHSEKEWKTIVDVLDADFGHLKYEDPSGKRVQVTAKGWLWLAERPKARGDVGFIAMAFDPSLDDVKAAIEQGIRSAGYTPLRIDEDHYIGGIMDRIVASIRESRFVVADFKLNRGGVYYEAGFAAGLDLPVFSLCEEGQTAPKSPERVHFDVAHLNILTWNKADLAQLSVRLRDRILAVLGKGPVAI